MKVACIPDSKQCMGAVHGVSWGESQVQKFHFESEVDALLLSLFCKSRVSILGSKRAPGRQYRVASTLHNPPGVPLSQL